MKIPLGPNYHRRDGGVKITNLVYFNYIERKERNARESTKVQAHIDMNGYTGEVINSYII